MTCPECGAEMNHHADKVDYAVPEEVDTVLGGAVEEVHTCPRCGDIAVRLAGSPEVVT